jgi:formylglycine-generating enzyme required for sulfatase activity
MVRRGVLWAMLAAGALLGSFTLAAGAHGGKAKSKARAAAGVATLGTPVEGRVLVRGGTFTMGSDAEDIAAAAALCRAEPAGEDCPPDEFADEYAPHPVTLSDFWIDRLEVTMSDYQRCAEIGPCSAVPLAAGGKRFERPNLPASMVTWSDAATYCRFRGGRLPTEAEWERAARGARSRQYPWGNVYNPRFANAGRLGLDPFEPKDGYLESAPVGSFARGQTPDKIADLAGNVEEWVADWYSPNYSEATEQDPKGPSAGDEKVLRGGSYVHGRPWLRAAARGHDAPSHRRPWRGFRCSYD